MVSNIDPDVPNSPHAYTADMRANFAAAKDEIEAMQAAVEALPPPPYDFLPLTGGQLSGPLLLPAGTAASPSLQFGAPDGTGMWRSVGNILAITLAGAFEVAFTPGLTQFYTPLSLLNNRIQQLGDATAAGDALNQRTGDTRYAPILLAQEVAALRRELDTLRRQLTERHIVVPAGVGMRTELLSAPP
jgi:hypothetical protein